MFLEAKWVVFCFFLLIQSMIDIRKKEISLRMYAVLVIVGVVWHMISKDWDGSFLYALLPGACTLGLSVLSEGQIGFGDGLMILAAGLYFSLEWVLLWSFMAFLLCGLFGMGLFLFCKKDRKEEIAFIPFLFVSAIAGGVVCFIFP